MEFSYGDGEYIEGARKYAGQIILSDHKLFLKLGLNDIAQTYVPLEKIRNLKWVSRGLEISVHPSVSFQYKCLIRGQLKNIRELTKDLVNRRQLKKHWFFPQWQEDSH